MQPMRTSILVALLAGAAALVLALSGCSSTSGSMNSGTMDSGTKSDAMYTLTFSGNGTFHGPHGGQTIHVALVNWDTTKVVAEKTGTVSRTADPAFSFTFPHAMKAGEDYHVVYWIDSNFGGGTPGKCDAPKHDHQWNISLGMVTGNINHVETHEPAKITPVCYLFQDNK